MKNIFVMGLNEFHLELLRTIRGPDAYEFHPLFEYAEVVHPPEREYPTLESLLHRAHETFDRLPWSVDAVIGYWDLPTTLAVPLIADRFGLHGAPLDAVARCEHKYWSRTQQREVLPDMVPAFQAVDPVASNVVDRIELEYPFWIKPVKAHSSYLGFFIDRPETLRRHLPEIRTGIGIMARPLKTCRTSTSPRRSNGSTASIASPNRSSRTDSSAHWKDSCETKTSQSTVSWTRFGLGGTARASRATSTRPSCRFRSSSA